MRKLLILIFLLCASGYASAGAYDEILKAADENDTVTVLDLLNRGMDVNTADREGTTLLMIAARSGNIDMLKTLLASRANVNRRNQYGDSALSIAALNGKLDVVKLLIGHKAEISHSGWAPLHYAVYGGNAEIAALLITNGAQLDALAPNNQTALMLAVKNGRLDLVQLLVKAKADIGLTDGDGRTALQLAQLLKFSDLADYLHAQGDTQK